MEEEHIPLKKKTLRENHAVFITNDLRKTIFTRSRLENNFIESPSEKNKNVYKIQRGKCVSIRINKKRTIFF